MKALLTSTAAALLFSTAAFADAHGPAAYQFNESSDFYASDLIGMRVYSTEAEMAGDTVAAGSETEWDDIGEINDLIVSNSGDVQAAIIGVGGFLGLVEKDVALTMDQIKVMTEDGDAGDRFLVVAMNKDMLETAPAFERVANTDVDAEANTEAEADATAELETDAEVDVAANEAAVDPEMSEDRPMLDQPRVEREGYTVAGLTDLTAEDLDGATVYGAEDESVGEIGKLILTESGQINQAVINVGGFLGIGEKAIAVSFDELQILRNEDGNDLRIYIDSTQEALEQQPEYQG